MKKIPTAPLILLTGLIFNTTVFAIFNRDMHRCKMEYTQLDLLTGNEKTYKNTTQIEVKFDTPVQEETGEMDIYGEPVTVDVALPDDYCGRAVVRLNKKIAKRIGKKSTNILVDYNIKVMCKKRNGGIFSSSWSKYKTCKVQDAREGYGYETQITDYMNDKYPMQVNNRLKYPEDYITEETEE
jgi:hypothetical protein